MVGSKVAWCVWPLCGALVACGSSKSSDVSPSPSGTGGMLQGTSGTSGAGMGGKAGGSGGAAGVSAPAGTSGGFAPANGGTTAGHAGGGASGRVGVAGGGATSGDAGLGGDAGEPDEGLPGAGTFTRFTLRSEHAPPTGVAGPCDTSQWSFERASRVLGWELCRGTAETPEQDSRTLSDAEAKATLDSVLRVRPSDVGLCLSDAPYFELELEVDGTSSVYLSNYYQCQFDGNYVEGLNDLVAVVDGLAVK